MIDFSEIKTTAKELLDFAEKQEGVKEAEAYVSCNTLNVYRIVYHSEIPSNGLEEPKSEENFGLSLRILFNDGKFGFGSTDSDLSRNGFNEAFGKAKESKVNDTDFHSLPEPRGKAELQNYHDKNIMNVDEEKAIFKAYELLDGAFDALNKKSFKAGTNITGEMDLMSSRMCVTSSKGIFGSDEHTSALGTLTSNLEEEDISAGSSYSSSTHLTKLDCFNVGADSVEKALIMRKPKGIVSGEYKVVLSRQAIAELFFSRFDLAISSIDFHASPFSVNIGEKVGNELFSVTENPHLENFIGSRAITDEGIPTQKNELITNGTLNTYQSNDYYNKKKEEWKKLLPINGFRDGLSRRYYSDVGIGSTNLVLGNGNYSEQELIEEVKDGIYVGRLWYTYPINGYSNFDFTSTIRGDSYIIKNGKLESALTPNTVRVLDSFKSFMNGITALGKESGPSQVWGQDALIITPKIALEKLKLKKISK
ncbi:MAG: TldD/PmbA family protein [archaeon]|nr:TldD/PmbA family protein [archaeon]